MKHHPTPFHARDSDPDTSYPYGQFFAIPSIERAFRTVGISQRVGRELCLQATHGSTVYYIIRYDNRWYAHTDSDTMKFTRDSAEALYKNADNPGFVFRDEAPVPENHELPTDQYIGDCDLNYRVQ